jgi:hypothetical protein
MSLLGTLQPNWRRLEMSAVGGEADQRCKCSNGRVSPRSDMRLVAHVRRFCAQAGICRQVTVAVPKSRCAVRVGGHREVKNGARGQVGGHPQPAAMSFDDRTDRRRGSPTMRALRAIPNALSSSRMRYFGLLAYGNAFAQPPFALLEDGSSQHLASVSQEGRKDANFFVSSGVTWRILAYAVGFPCGLAANQDAGVQNSKNAAKATSLSKRCSPR